jgi:hypothetical protein
MSELMAVPSPPFVLCLAPVVNINNRRGLPVTASQVTADIIDSNGLQFEHVHQPGSNLI